MAGSGTGELKIWAVVLAAGAVLIGLGIGFGIPALEQAVAALAPGIGLKDAALWSFGVTVVLFVLFAVIAGDGLIGELQFMLGGFFLFFAVFTLLIAWIF